MVVIVRFNVGGDRMGIEWRGWFGRWVNGERSGKCERWALVGFPVGISVGTFGTGGCWHLLHDCCIYC